MNELLQIDRVPRGSARRVVQLQRRSRLRALAVDKVGVVDEGAVADRVDVVLDHNVLLFDEVAQRLVHVHALQLTPRSHAHNRAEEGHHADDSGVQTVLLDQLQLRHVQELGQPTHNDGDRELMAIHGEGWVVGDGEDGVLRLGALNERYAFKLNAELNGAQRVDGGERVQNHAHLLVVHRQQRPVEDLIMTPCLGSYRVAVVLPLREDGVIYEPDRQRLQKDAELAMIKHH